MTDPMFVGLIGGNVVLAVTAGLCLLSSSRWQTACLSAQSKIDDARAETKTWKQISEDNGADAVRLASEAASLRARLRGHEALRSEPKLIRIPKGQPGAGRFIPNPKWKAELTA